jgi:hypothetical protein
MPWRRSLVLLVFSVSLFADDASVWREYGLVKTQTSSAGKLSVTTYQMKDLTGALAAWQWQRSADAKPCDLAPLCSQDAARTVISADNYLVVFDGGKPTKPQVDTLLNSLPNRKDTSLPAILTFIPRNGLVPNSSRYVLGPESLKAFAPELKSAKPGFNEGAEAQIAQYDVDKSGKPVRLAIFYYPTPEMARLHAADFKSVANTRVKRSTVLVALVIGDATEVQADTILSRVEYEAKVTWNEVPPPSPIKPLYQLLVNIIWLSVMLSALCLVAGLIYAGMRLYRRRYGSLESEEAMTTLHLTGD